MLFFSDKYILLDILVCSIAVYCPPALLAFLPKFSRKVLFNKHTHAILKLYTNTRLTGFSFVETFLLKFIIKYGRNLFSMYEHETR